MKKGRIVLVVLIAIAIVAVLVGRPYYELHFSTINSEEGDKTIFIPSGSSLNEVATLIAQQNILDKDDFLDYATKLGLTTANLEAGKYEIKAGTKIKHLIYGFKNGNQEVKDVRVTFNNCNTIYDMASKVAPAIEADSTELVTFIMNPATLEKYGFTEATVTALFLPDTYEIGEWDITAEAFVQRMADEYKKFWTADRIAKANALNLTQSEIATLASIIEAEQSINTVEWKTIAGLYLNRVRRGMLLQSDPTAKFCWGDELEGVQRLLTVHMQRDCPYNTYLYPGLPPGPIRMSSKKAMDAVLNAEKHNYLFMCAKPGNSGLHNFAETNAQHNVNAAKWRKYARERGL